MTLPAKQERPIPMVHNLVIGMVAPYGAGCSSLADILTRTFQDFPACLVRTIHVAKLIESDYSVVSGKSVILQEAVRPAELRRTLQAAGTALRTEDLEIVGRSIVTEIFRLGNDLEDKGELSDKKLLVLLVDSLKNINDVKVLRRVYGQEFCLMSVHAPHEERWGRMKKYKSWTDGERVDFEELDKIDSDEKSVRPEVKNAGQQVSKVAATADYHIVNTLNLQELEEEARRLTHLLLGYGLNQPTFHERFMHIAFSASNSSGCLSKQVGAAIVDATGHVLGVGYNDVPKAGGGLYTLGSDDKRCYQMGDCRCINDTNKQERFEALQTEICNAFAIEDQDRLRQIIWKSQFKESTEYCRAVHAEMEALLSLTRNPGHSAIGSTIYVTTYPCHNCTKHILASGISKVVYIEPYPKSLAEELHGDAIEFDASENGRCSDKLLFVPYRGVAPNRYEDFFTMKEERKGDDGKMIRKTKAEAVDAPLFARELPRRSRGLESRDSITMAEMKEVPIYTTIIGERTAKEARNESGGKS